MWLLATSIISGSFTYMWLWIAIIFAIIEGITIGIVSIWFSIGALVALLASLFIQDLFLQILVFFVTSAFLLVKTRKIAIEKLKIGQHKTNIDELIDEECVVVKAIEHNLTGEVKLRGMTWRASSDSNQTYDVGDLVHVLRIEGVTIIVK